MALEDAGIESANGVDAEGTVAALADATSEASVAASDAAMDAEPVEAIAEATDTTHDDMTVLEDTAAQVAESLNPEGDEAGEGLSPTAAALAVECLTRIREKHFLPTSRVSSPAKESFKPRASRKAMTRLALEGFGDTLVSMWKRIKEFFKGLWARIVNGVKSIFQSNIRTEKRAVELLKTLGTLPNKNIKERSVKSKSIAKGFCGTDRKTNGDTTKAILDRQLKLIASQGPINKVVSNKQPELMKIVDRLSDLLKDNGTAAVRSPQGNTTAAATSAIAYTELTAFAKSFVDAVVVDLDKATGINKDSSEFKDVFDGNNVDRQNSKLDASGPFFNSRYFFAATIEHTATSGNTAVPSTFTVGFKEVDASPPSEADTLTPDQGEEVCRRVMKICQQVAEAERAIKVGSVAGDGLLKVVDGGIKMAEDAASKMSSSDDPATSGHYSGVIKAIQNVRSMVQNTINVLTASNGQIPTLTMSCSNTALDYVNASIKNYEK